MAFDAEHGGSTYCQPAGRCCRSSPLCLGRYPEPKPRVKPLLERAKLVTDAYHHLIAGRVAVGEHQNDHLSTVHGPGVGHGVQHRVADLARG